MAKTPKAGVRNALVGPNKATPKNIPPAKPAQKTAGSKAFRDKKF